MPSWYVRSLLSLPVGRSLNPISTSTCGTRMLIACTVSSVSISNSRESAGNDLTKRRENTRYPLSMSVTGSPNSQPTSRLNMRFPVS